MSFSKIAIAWAAGLTALTVVTSCQKSDPGSAAAGTTPPATTATTATTAAALATPAAPKAAAAVPEAVRKLLGKWVRADGGYVLELKSADLSGVLEAGYFNPKSIRVSRAVWMQGGQGLQVAVELNDVGYPGATYVLTYDAANDKLAGQYTQPQMQQTFDIEFVRQPKP